MAAFEGDGMRSAPSRRPPEMAPNYAAQRSELAKRTGLGQIRPRPALVGGTEAA